MRLRFLPPAAVIAVACALGWLSGSGRLTPALAEDKKTDSRSDTSPDRTLQRF